MKSIELFAGGGGLLLGSSLAGFHHLAAAEWNKWATATLRNNISDGYPLIQGLEVIEGDVRSINWNQFNKHEIDLVSGGPPCQPFPWEEKRKPTTTPETCFLQ